MRKREIFFWALVFLVLVSLLAAHSQEIAKTETGFYYPTGTDTFRGPGFLATPPEYFQGEYHLGQDIKAPVGDEIYAIAEGEIVRLSFQGWGKDNCAAIVQHQLVNGEVFYAVYGHIFINNSLKPGQKLKAGEPFATVGPWPFGSHLHFGIYPGNQPPTAPLGKAALPPGWKPGQPLDPKGFVDPVAWIKTMTPPGQIISEEDLLLSDKKVDNFMPAISPNGELVSFVSDREGNNEIYLMKIDGTCQVRLTNHSANDCWPTWLSDSARVIFQSDRRGKKDLWMIDLKSGQEECLTKDIAEDCTFPLFDPDRQWINFWRGSCIWKLIFNGPSYYFEKPDEKQTFIYGDRNFQTIKGYYDKSKEEIVNPSGLFSCKVDDRFLFYSNRGGDFDIYWMREDGSAQEPIILLPGDQKRVSAINHGGAILLAFESNHEASEKGYDIYFTILGINRIIRLTYGSDVNKINEFWQQAEEEKKKQAQKEEEEKRAKAILNILLRGILKQIQKQK